MYRWSAPGTHLPTDFVIANCLLYWFTGSLTSSFWLYYLFNSGNGAEYQSLGGKIEQPTAIGFGKFQDTTSLSGECDPNIHGTGPHEIAWAPKRYAVRIGINVSSWNVLERGGHFLAAEAPDLVAKDVDRHFSSEEVKKALAN
jgi:epoxide hydrolase